jgi:hypothetical protein
LCCGLNDHWDYFIGGWFWIAIVVVVFLLIGWRTIGRNQLKVHRTVSETRSDREND